MDEETRALSERVVELEKQHSQLSESVNMLMRIVIALSNRIDPPERQPEGSHVAFWRSMPDGNPWSADVTPAEDWDNLRAKDPTVLLLGGPMSEAEAKKLAAAFEEIANRRAGSA